MSIHQCVLTSWAFSSGCGKSQHTPQSLDIRNTDTNSRQSVISESQQSAEITRGNWRQASILMSRIQDWLGQRLLHSSSTLAPFQATPLPTDTQYYRCCMSWSTRRLLPIVGKVHSPSVQPLHQEPPDLHDRWVGEDGYFAVCKCFFPGRYRKLYLHPSSLILPRCSGQWQPDRDQEGGPQRELGCSPCPNPAVYSSKLWL
ncbi:hypothetical protein QR685DRAFT_244509 [Neurospora intermedia]|uniref:Uncharacterized protein n=1 Tax=Neurospora intermedia TaxID=5142 RepID=A0ABR3DBR1_NEUIN